MEREILFRGKLEETSKWVYGYYTEFSECDHYHFIDNREGSFRVVEETVGQYTGLKDKNGVKIFEGDVISTDLDRPYNIVCFKNGAFMMQCEDNGEAFYDIFYPCEYGKTEIYPYGEVIGNIFDNQSFIP